jgi:hypothetical protein
VLASPAAATAGISLAHFSSEFFFFVRAANLTNVWILAMGIGRKWVDLWIVDLWILYDFVNFLGFLGTIFLQNGNFLDKFFTMNFCRCFADFRTI